VPASWRAGAGEVRSSCGDRCGTRPSGQSAGAGNLPLAAARGRKRSPDFDVVSGAPEAVVSATGGVRRGMSLRCVCRAAGGARRHGDARTHACNSGCPAGWASYGVLPWRAALKWSAGARTAPSIPGRAKGTVLYPATSEAHDRRVHFPNPCPAACLFGPRVPDADGLLSLPTCRGRIGCILTKGRLHAAAWKVCANVDAQVSGRKREKFLRFTPF